MAEKPTPPLADYLFAWGTNHEPGWATGCTVEIGHGHVGVFPGRKPITDDPWPFTPGNCGFATYQHGHWTRDEKFLFCAGCGLDCT